MDTLAITLTPGFLSPVLGVRRAGYICLNRSDPLGESIRLFSSGSGLSHLMRSRCLSIIEFRSALNSATLKLAFFGGPHTGVASAGSKEEDV